MRGCILDVDGTLVDTAYHHALAWFRAFGDHDITIPVWVVHRHVGMGGDQLVKAVAGDDVERELGDALRQRWRERFDELLGEIVPLPHANGFLRQLAQHDIDVVLASSAVREHLEAFLALIDAQEHLERAVSKDDVDASKPAPDLVQVARDRISTADVVMVGDTPWDAKAATRAGVPFVAVLTGGFAESELTQAGARTVHRDLEGVLGAIA
jgi:HAD superfamily hydrolase (TIGR01549 family)